MILPSQEQEDFPLETSQSFQNSAAGYFSTKLPDAC